MWEKEMPLKVYQRKNALMSSPGIAFARLRLREALMRACEDL
jgi:hypothetical protein